MDRKRSPKMSEPEEKEQAMRINRYLASAGIASRRKVEDLIKAGLVNVNGKVVEDLATRVRPGDRVTVHGDEVKSTVKFIYIVLNKPKNTITTSEDEKGRYTVLDIVRKQERIFPVGRLDRNTTGALLLTNDGDLAFRLTHPKFQIERVYLVGLDRKLTQPDARAISMGIKLEDGMTDHCEIIIDPHDNTQATLMIHEGKNREVRRIFEHLGYEVKRLDRKEFARINTKGLARGEYRSLTRYEIADLRKMVKLD